MLLDARYPVVTGSPWHKQHVDVLKRYIGNFKEYARRSHKTYAFDLMICAISCCAVDLAKEARQRGPRPRECCDAL